MGKRRAPGPSNQPRPLSEGVALLSRINLSDYNTWVSAGLAMKTLYKEEGLDPWLAQSKMCSPLYIEADARTKWGTLTPNGTAGWHTLVDLAKKSPFNEATDEIKDKAPESPPNEAKEAPAPEPEPQPTKEKEKEAEPSPRKTSQEAITYTPIIPVPADAPPPPKMKAPSSGVDAVTYRNRQGEIICLQYRHEDDNGAKRDIPMTFCALSNGRPSRWYEKAPPTPRPLWNLDMIARAPDAVVLILEGAFKAFMCQLEFPYPEFVVTAGFSGGSGYRNDDWGQLANRKVILWPDKDAVGDKWLSHAPISPVQFRLRLPALEALIGKPLPEGGDYVDAWLMKFDMGALAQAMREAMALWTAEPIRPDLTQALAAIQAIIDAPNAYARKELELKFIEAPDSAEIIWALDHFEPDRLTALFLRCNKVIQGRMVELRNRYAAAQALARKTMLDASILEMRDTSRDGIDEAQEEEFQLNDSGVHMLEQIGEATFYRRICSPIEVLCHVRDDRGHDWGALLLVTDKDGAKHELVIENRVLAGDGLQLRECLRDYGATHKPDAKARLGLIRYIDERKALSSPRRCVRKVGWTTHDIPSFIFPDGKSIAPSNDAEPVHLMTEGGRRRNPYAQKGDMAGWKTLAQLAQDNSVLTAALSIAFAPPCLRFVGVENRIVHFYGLHGKGKSVTALFACSVWGRASRNDGYLNQWSGTANGLESTFAMHNDTLLVLDEAGSCEARDMQQIIYRLSNAQGKVRANRMGDARERSIYRTLVLSTGEAGLHTMLKSTGKRVFGGLRDRALDIPVCQFEHGTFEALHGQPSGAKFAEVIERDCMKHFGTAGPVFIQYLVTQNQDAIREQLLAAMEQFNETASIASLPSHLQRPLKALSLMAAAGELAIQAECLPLRPGSALAASIILTEKWVEAQGIGCTEAPDEQALMLQIKLFIEQHASSRMPLLGGPSVMSVPNQAGYRRESASVPGRIEYLFLPNTFESVIVGEFDRQFVIDVLMRLGAVKLDSSRQRPPTTEKFGPSAGLKRFYVLFDDKLGL